MSRLAAPLFALILFGLLPGSGCPSDSASSRPVDQCTSVGEQCRLSDGQLGVCNLTTDGAFICTSQH